MYMSRSGRVHNYAKSNQNQRAACISWNFSRTRFRFVKFSGRMMSDWELYWVQNIALEHCCSGHRVPFIHQYTIGTHDYTQNTPIKSKTQDWLILVGEKMRFAHGLYWFTPVHQVSQGSWLSHIHSRNGYSQNDTFMWKQSHSQIRECNWSVFLANRSH